MFMLFARCSLMLPIFIIVHYEFVTLLDCGTHPRTHSPIIEQVGVFHIVTNAGDSSECVIILSVTSWTTIPSPILLSGSPCPLILILILTALPSNLPPFATPCTPSRPVTWNIPKYCTWPTSATQDMYVRTEIQHPPSKS